MTAVNERVQRQTPPITMAGLGHLAVVYVVWGSTYLAIRIAVREGTGFPPFAMSASRVLLAGAALLAWSWLRGHRVRLRQGEVWTLAGSGLLLWLGGNGMIVWAEQRAESGYSALLVSSTPIWVAAVQAFLERRAPTPFLVLSLLAGLGGVGLLTARSFAAGSAADPTSAAVLVLASVSWGIGSLLQQRRPAAVSPLVSAAYQLLFGGLGTLAVSLLARESWPTPTAEAFAAWFYLVTIGSLLGFTSFVQALHRLPTSIVMTYSYVNPAIAVLLGAIVLGEPITAWTAAGMACVLVGVAGVFRDRYLQRRRPARRIGL